MALQNHVQSKAVPRRVTQRVAVEIADAVRFSEIRPAWLDLLTRAAEPNAFMDPALVRAAAEADPEVPIRVLLAWTPAVGSAKRQLVGVWAFAVCRPRRSPMPLRTLNAPVHAHGHLATPVVDRADPDETLDAMLDAVADDAQCPKIIALAAMGTEGPTMAALTRVLACRGSAPCMFEQSARPKLASDLDGESYLKNTMSASSRKKLRQHRRRLCEKGALARVTATDPEAVRRAIEQFLVLEAAGWKGRQGTAFLCHPAEAAFLRTAMGALAEQGCASIDALTVNGRPVSMQIILRSGEAAFTWKTAFDEQFQDVSPGMLLLEDYTTSLLADERIAFVDSCAQDDSGFMAVSERQPVADLWLDARRGGSLAFRSLSALQRSYRELRATAKSAYHAARRPRKR
jgi:CelD/BcsL family acetyltransferase involved in cellulose biosynthesis